MAKKHTERSEITYWTECPLCRNDEVQFERVCVGSKVSCEYCDWEHQEAPRENPKVEGEVVLARKPDVYAVEWTIEPKEPSSA